MREIVFFLEEESAKAMLQTLLPRIVGEAVHPRFVVFEGKQDLHRKLEKKLSGYLNPSARFIVIRDQDNDDCKKVKRSLKSICHKAGHPNAIVRIACRELESFYLGDLRAVELGLEIRGVAAKQSKAKYRKPDELHTPYKELCILTGNRYQKIAGSRSIARHLNIEAPGSDSFRHLLSAIRKCFALG